MSTRVRRAVAAVSIAVASGVLAVHATSTFLHVAPKNPISISNHAAITSYIDPFFHQNWQLFAPNPVETDDGVLVRAKLRDKTGAERVTEYIDLTTPNLERTLHTPFPDRLPRVLSHVRRTYSENVRTIRSVDGGESADKTADTPLLELTEDELAKAIPEQRRSFELTKSLLTSIVLRTVRSHWSDEITAIQLRFVQHAFPRFSQRHDRGVGKVSHWTLSWWPISPNESQPEQS